MDALELSQVDVDLDGATVLAEIDWTVTTDERWVVLGPNGSGKSTLMRLASLYLHPTRGSVEVLGERLGATDVRVLRRRIGFVSAGFARLLRPGVTANEIVMAGHHAALETWWHDYDRADERRALDLLERFGVGRCAHHGFGTLSSGEQQRVLLARAMANEPELLLLDEPMAGLDLGGREQVIASIDAMAADRTAPPFVLVTHHVEEIPPAMTHVLLLDAGRVSAAGPIEDLGGEDLSACFHLPLELGRDQRSGRFSARPG